MNALATYGWDPLREEEFRTHRDGGLIPGRIIEEHKDRYAVVTETGPGTVYRPKQAAAEDRAYVGDWVALQPVADVFALRAILTRRNALTRKVAGPTTVPQPLAANVDLAFITTAADRDLNERRIERYMTTINGSGVEPVIVLTKADLHPDPAEAVARALAVAGDVPVILTSAVTGQGLGEISALVRPGVTIAVVGSSGVGKSSLLNLVAGEALQVTREVRHDGRGKHTTTSRRLVPIAGGGLILDTPGMRELQLWDVDDGLDASFEDIAQLAELCAFRDCAHATEPGCAVKAAADSGELDPGRLDSYRKLERELRSLEVRRDKRAQIEERRRRRVQARAIRQSQR